MNSKTIRNNYLTGVIDMLILTLLQEKDSYGYELTNAIDPLSNGLIKVSLNTIYASIYKLQSAGYINEYTTKVGQRRVRVYYKINDSGREYLSTMEKEYQKVSDGLKKVRKNSIKFRDEK